MRSSKNTLNHKHLNSLINSALQHYKSSFFHAFSYVKKGTPLFQSSSKLSEKNFSFKMA